MTLPKELTTVTPTSRIIAIIIILTLPFIGFFLGIRYQQFITTLQRNNTNIYSTNIIKKQPTDANDLILYRDDKHSFEFTYPKEWEITSTCAKQFCVVVQDFNSFPTSQQNINSAIDGTTKEEYKYIQDKIEKGLPLDGYYKNWKTITINNRKAIQYMGFDKPSGDYIYSTLVYTDTFVLGITYKLPLSNPQLKYPDNAYYEIQRRKALQNNQLSEDDKKILEPYTKVISSLKFDK